MRLFCVIFLLCTCIFSSFSQKEIGGRVINKDNNNPLPSVNVTLHPAGSPNILTYTITGEDGVFTLRMNNMPDSVTIYVRAMTIEAQSKTIKSNNPGFIEFAVDEKVTELKEVIVKAPKIRQMGDTINYSVLSFIDETDRSIGDVLKKLPGVQVLSSGKILYQNKEISKFYVEGLDLLQGKYGVATNNIDAQQVATVQVLENHQPIKALKDMEVPENAAINLKLKQSALGAFFLTAQAGIGLPPLLLSNELIGMRFTRTQQNMLVYKGDNTGRDISKELTSFYDMFSTPINFMSVQAPSPPSIQEQHYLFNDAHVISLNDLRTLKKDFILTSNLNYLYDNQKSNSFAKQDIFVDQGQPIHIAEDLSSRFNKRELDGNISLESNTDVGFLENKFHITSKWNDMFGDVAAAQNVSQWLKTPSFKAENKFNYLKRENTKRFRVGSTISFNTHDHALQVSPILYDNFSVFSPGDTIMSQNVSFNHFKADMFISGGNEKGRFATDYRLGAFVNLYNMNSGILMGQTDIPISADSLRNDIKRNETGAELSAMVSYRFSRVSRLYTNIPVKILYLDRQYRVRDAKKDNMFLLFGPNIALQHRFTTRTELDANLSFSNNIGSITEDYIGYIMTTYRSLNKNEGILSKNRQTSAYVYLNYRNPFTTLFTTLSLSYTNQWKNLLYDIRYSGILNNTVSISHPNNSQYYGANLTLGQSVDAINSEVRIAARYNRSNSLSLNQGIISEFTSNSFSVSPSIKTDIRRNLITQYSATYQHSNNKIKAGVLPSINYFSQNLSISFLPVKKLIFNLTFNHYYNNLIESNSRSSLFGNAGIKYKWEKVDIMLDWTNIFNTDKFITYSYNDISSYYSAYSLRPTELLLRVRFKIL